MTPEQYQELNERLSALEQRNLPFPLDPLNRRIINRDLPVMKRKTGDVWTVEINDREEDWDFGAGGGVAGSDTQVQFNDGGAFGGDAGLTYNKTTDTLSVSSISSLSNTDLSITTPDSNISCNIEILPGSAVSGNNPGGSISLTGGNSSGSAEGGDLFFTCGDAGTTGDGGDVVIDGGQGGSTSGNGGNITVTAGNAFATGSGVGGNCNLSSGSGIGSGNKGGDVVITTGDASNTNAKAGRLKLASEHDSGIVTPFQMAVAYISTSNGSATSSDTQVSPALITNGNAVLVEIRVVAVRTGGTSGATGDSAAYIRRGLFKRVAGTVSLVGSVQDDFTAEDQAAWDATLVVSGDNILAQVTGAANNNVDWQITFMFQDAI